MKYKYRLQAKNGFSLVEALVTAAILGILGLALSQLITIGNKGSQHITQGTTLSLLEQQAQYLLSKNCIDAIAGIPPGAAGPQTWDHVGVPLTSLKARSIAGILTDFMPTNPPPNRDPTKFTQGVNLDSITLEPSSANGSDPTMAQVHMVFSRMEKIQNGGPLDDFVVQISIVYETTSPTKIKSCSTAGTGAPTSFCYAVRASRYGSPMCRKDYYMKSILKGTDGDSDSIGAICCHLQLAADADIQAMHDNFPTGVDKKFVKRADAIGVDYNTLVGNCRAAKMAGNGGMYADGTVSCPSPDDATTNTDEEPPTLLVPTTGITFTPVPGGGYDATGFLKTAENDCSWRGKVTFTVNAHDDTGVDTLVAAVGGHNFPGIHVPGSTVDYTHTFQSPTIIIPASSDAFSKLITLKSTDSVIPTNVGGAQTFPVPMPPTDPSCN